MTVGARVLIALLFVLTIGSAGLSVALMDRANDLERKISSLEQELDTGFRSTYDLMLLMLEGGSCSAYRHATELRDAILELRSAVEEISPPFTFYRWSPLFLVGAPKDC